MTTEYVETAVIGGGQAGLVTGYYLAQRGLDFVIFDASERVGDAWRKRWDSLRIFTPARHAGLPGMRFPAPPDSFPTKDQVADYLEAYADRFALPVRLRTRVNELTRESDAFVLSVGGRRVEAANVVVAMSNYQLPTIPAFAAELRPDILQLHSKQYRNPSQLQPGPALVVGASDSGCEIALDVAKAHKTWLSGRHPGHVPFRLESALGRHVVIPLAVGQIFHRVLSISNPIGRALRPRLLHAVGPNIRVKPRAIAAAGVERASRVTAVKDGLPVLEDARALDVANVIWCTGFRPDYSWIKLPVFCDAANPKEPLHDRGVVSSEPGLYFVGLYYLYSITSSFLFGVPRDARYIARTIAANPRRAARIGSAEPLSASAR